jgi:hypothetical protein
MILQGNRTSTVQSLAWIFAGVMILSLPVAVLAQRSGIPESQITPILQRAQQIHSLWKASGVVFPDQDQHVRAQSIPAATPPPNVDSCCSAWQGFNFTGVLSVAPSDATGRSCVNCATGFTNNNIGIPFPQGRAFQGNKWSTFMTFQSTIAGACTVTFLWFRLPNTTTPIQGFQSHIADCGSNTIWVWEFFNFVVPATPGNAVAVGIIQASNGTMNVDFEQFLIQ